MLEMTEVFKTRGRTCPDYVRFPPVHCVEDLEHNVASAVGVMGDGVMSDGDFVGLPCAVIWHQGQALVLKRH